MLLIIENEAGQMYRYILTNATSTTTARSWRQMVPSAPSGDQRRTGARGGWSTTPTGQGWLEARLEPSEQLKLEAFAKLWSTCDAT